MLPKWRNILFIHFPLNVTFLFTFSTYFLLVYDSSIWHIVQHMYMHLGQADLALIWQDRRRRIYMLETSKEYCREGVEEMLLFMSNVKIWWHLGFCTAMIDRKRTCMWMGDKAVRACVHVGVWAWLTVNWKGQQVHVLGSDRHKKCNLPRVQIFWGNLIKVRLWLE